MMWYDSSDNSAPIILPQDTIAKFLNKHGDIQGFRVADHFLMLETGAVLSHLQEKYSVREEPFPLPAFFSHSLFAIEGEPEISFVEKTFAAPIAVAALETSIAMGCKKLFAFGTCGAVAEHLNVGDIVIPTEIIREEGTSYHYAASGINATPDKHLMECLLGHCSVQKVLPVHAGKTVSTDAVFRQTVTKELGWRANEILAIDMEMSALLTVARYHQIPAVSLLVVSDKHDLKEGSQWHWGGETLQRNRKIAIDLLIGFMRKNQNSV